MKLTIALAGNPNSGKTTLFNTLTGSNQFVGNWPGVTVEKKEGKLKKNTDITITDLPGIYSLSPYTLEEVVARNYLLSKNDFIYLQENTYESTNETDEKICLEKCPEGYKSVVRNEESTPGESTTGSQLIMKECILDCGTTNYKY